MQKTGGSNPEEMIYFSGKPVALFNPVSGAWTDLIWAGSNIVAEVPGSQGATPTWRLLDHEGSLVATTDNSGNIDSSNLIAPYGQLMATSTSDRTCIPAYIRTQSMAATMPGITTTPQSRPAGCAPTPTTVATT